MTETPKCPYCGAEMEQTGGCWVHKNVPKKLYMFFCEKCRCGSPVEETPEEALSAALHRAEPKKDEKEKAE